MSPDRRYHGMRQTPLPNNWVTCYDKWRALVNSMVWQETVSWYDNKHDGFLSTLSLMTHNCMRRTICQTDVFRAVIWDVIALVKYITRDITTSLSTFFHDINAWDNPSVKQMCSVLDMRYYSLCQTNMFRALTTNIFLWTWRSWENEWPWSE